MWLGYVDYRPDPLCRPEFYLEEYAASLQGHEAARLRPIWRERHQGMFQTTGFTFFLRSA